MRKIVILTGAGGDFMPAIDFGSFGNVADPDVSEHRQHPRADDLGARQPAFVGAQGKTILDPDFDIDDQGLPREKPTLLAK